MKHVKKQLSILCMLVALMLLTVISCAPDTEKEEDLICKVSVISGKGGTAISSENEVVSGWKVTLTAIPEETYRFVNWTLGGEEVSRENPYKAVITKSAQYQANFEKDNYKVSVKATEGGSVKASHKGDVLNGTEVTFTATPQENYGFVNWTVNGVEVSTKNPYTAIITEDIEIKANFATYKVTVVSSEGGTAEASKTQAGHNEEITLTATPNDGYSFVNWTVNGEEVSVENPYTATITANTEYVANFEKQSNNQTIIDPISSMSYDELVYVEGGTFTMGATSEQGSDSSSDERPTHSVTLSSYYIGKYEVTQQLWEYVMSYSGTAADGTTMTAYSSDVWLGENPSSSYGKGNNYPAYYVSWNDIVNIFLPRLNKITGGNYRLPTEAEWEYAARGGNRSQGYKYSGSNTIGDVAWYSGNSGGKTHTVGTKQANELGIYDMSGNVWEWCSDWYGSYSSSPQTNPTGPTSGSSRVGHGGNWYANAFPCRVSYRSAYNPNSRFSSSMGFRLASDL